jgi:carbamoyl-phosphate synthase large subunit
VEAAIGYCDEHRIGLVIPTRDAELPYWAAARGELAAAGIDVLVPDADAVESCLDKLRFARLLLDAGEPAIPTSLAPGELEAAERYVVKERFGAGAQRMGLDLDREAADAHAATLEHPVFQPFVRGDEFSIDLYVARDGTVQGVIARRRELVRGGESQITATVPDPALETCGARIAQLLRLRGHAVIQILVDAIGRHHVVECNPRFGGASTLALAAGLDTFAWAYLEAHGQPLTSRPFHRVHGEQRQVRYPADKILPA